MMDIALMGEIFILRRIAVQDYLSQKAKSIVPYTAGAQPQC